jgi:LysR family transcriptional regulator of gallate degradation
MGRIDAQASDNPYTDGDMFELAKFPNLRHLRMVQVIGRVGGVSGAARELCTSQPTVTNAVANVEAEIGGPVFERRATGTYPTVAGKQFLIRIDRFFDILDTALVHFEIKPGNSQDRPKPRADRLLTGTQLRAVIVTSEHGQADELAQNLGLSAATLFRSARTVERTLGKPLFDRTAQGLIPTKAGEILAREFKRAIREIELAQGEILLEKGTENLEIVIGALPMAGSFELATASGRFLDSHPAVKLRLNIREYDKLIIDLMNSKIDILFGMLRKPEWASEIDEQPLFEDRYCVVARSGHPLASAGAVTPADLTAYPWIVPSHGTPRRRRIEALFHETQRPARFMLETSSPSMCRALLLRSDMITLMTRSEVQADLHFGVLVDVSTTYFDDVLLKGVAIRKDWLPTQAHLAFLDCLREATAASAGGGAG